ncbi:hypothetical protein BY996DRAFT_6738283 [Phakopsora pachyrhizi]|uniref:Uncharacterized protein n=1 Tax=Phakopsora pachyrhizi TaxID=170000 RepID=A0AAV0AMQ3_PHAPC|nr:hypothetical protein BY996DRAFT_6738283 [Phakopsora pachyrhizi]CAH7668452.1 hypothetical protein PPACK8108_LOCUS2964 [Phakopsora pachyrhizi]
MVTGQLTRSEAESALRRLQGLRDDWARQRTRWSEHHQKALDIKALQRNPSAPLIYTVEVCCNQMGIATIRFNELERLIQDFRACALYLVHLPIPEGPDASFRSALPDLWSIPHSAPGIAAVALPGQVAGFSAQMAPVSTVQGLSDQIVMYNGYPSNPNENNVSYYGINNPTMPGNSMMTHQQQAQSQGMNTGFQSYQQQPPMIQFQPQQQPQINPYSTQPLPPQHTQALYHQQMFQNQQVADQSRVNQFASNVFQPQHAFQNPQNINQSNQSHLTSPLNPYNPNPPHGAVLDASQRYPAVQ